MCFNGMGGDVVFFVVNMDLPLVVRKNLFDVTQKKDENIRVTIVVVMMRKLVRFTHSQISHTYKH